MSNDDTEESAATTDLYACLGVARDASQAEIATAYRRLSRVVHPDKRPPPLAPAASAASADDAQEAAAAAYQRIRRAYDVLRDADSRRVYDEFGLEGLRALSDGAVALRGRGALEIREELEKLRQLRQEAEVMKLTQPATRLTVGLNVASLFAPADGGDSDGQQQPRGVYLDNLGFSQNTSFLLTPRHRLTLAGSLSSIGRRYVPSVSLAVRSQLTDRLSTEATCGLNYLPTASGKLTYRLAPNLMTSLRLEATMLQGGRLLPTAVPSLSCQISPRCLGTLSYAWNSPTKGARAELLCQLDDGWHAKAAAFMSPSDVGARLSVSRQLGDLRVGAACKVSLNSLWTLSYTLAQNVSEYSEASMSVKFGPAVGVRVKLCLSRGNQLYALPVTLATDWVDPAAIVYGTAAPLLAYVVIYKCIYAPWLQSFQRESHRQQADAESSARAARRSEALAAQSLMRQSARNSRHAERARNGLVIERAIYGYLAESAAAADDADAEAAAAGAGDDGQPPTPAEDGNAAASYIDVTDCLQIMVDASRLEIPASLTKADLPGFCDPAPPPQDSGGAAGLQQLHLLIRYSFQGRRHSALLADSDAVRLPQRAHAL